MYFCWCQRCITCSTQSPASGSHHLKASRADRFSGLWEYYYDDEADGRGEKISESKDAEEPQLKNVRGFLLKKRKPGWHKVIPDGTVLELLVCVIINTMLNVILT